MLSRKAYAFQSYDSKEILTSISCHLLSEEWSRSLCLDRPTVQRHRGLLGRRGESKEWLVLKAFTGKRGYDRRKRSTLRHEELCESGMPAWSLSLWLKMSGSSFWPVLMDERLCICESSGRNEGCLLEISEAGWNVLIWRMLTGWNLTSILDLHRVGNCLVSGLTLSVSSWSSSYTDYHLELLACRPA